MNEPIKGFHGEHRFLSNFSRCYVVLDGVTYPTVEHAYQAAKTLVPEFREAIQQCETPGDAKRMGQQLHMRKDWDSVKLGVMGQLLRQKFKLDYYRKELLNTGSRELIEENTWNDTFWGVCNGFGRNWLGQLLMEVRTELQWGSRTFFTGEGFTYKELE